jgi:hypothetical protein
MKVAFNTMLKNEERILPHILKIWSTYPVDLFIFYDDNSTDKSVEIIKEFLPKEKVIIVNDKLPKFNESYYRQKMLDVSKENKVDFVFSIDCDELLTSNITKNFNNFIKIYNEVDLQLYWYNCVNDTIKEYRSDPQYKNNYRSFILPLNKIGKLNLNDWKYHTPRTPFVNLRKSATRDFGVLHLQAINKKFYAIKQLWYKHFEFVNYKHSVDFINSRYDPVVNNLIFNEEKISNDLIEGIEFDSKVFDGLEIEKGYLDFIHKNYNESLVTFGKEYL